MERKILIVDDDNGILEATKEVLNVFNYRVYTLEDSYTFIDFVKILKPEIILMDVNLPGESGIDLIKKLKIDPATFNIPALIFTGNKNPINDVNECGANGYIEKPYSVSSLIAKLDTFFHNGR